MATVLITGGTGLIGSHLIRELRNRGYQVAMLSRKKNLDSDIPIYAWNLEKKEIDPEAVKTADYIIHLAGANLGEKRWTATQRKLIIDSRVKTAELLFEKIKESHNVLKSFISASAIGYYGTSPSDKIFKENDPPADDFLGYTCSLWEQAADKFKELGVRAVKLRTGIVLTKEGGTLARMALPVKLGIASPLGKGGQYLPWIHINDLCAIYIKAIEDPQMTGAYNAVAPDHKTNAEFTSAFARVLRKPFWFPNVPGVVLKLIYGKMSALILKGNRVSADKIISSGYKFKFPDLKGALEDLFGKD
jgi:uncharacterized protein